MDSDMTIDTYQFQFDDSISAGDVEETLGIAVIATECLHGEAQVQLDRCYRLNKELKLLSIEAGTDVGRDLNRLFLGFATREFGRERVRVLKMRDEIVPDRGRT